MASGNETRNAKQGNTNALKFGVYSRKKLLPSENPKRRRRLKKRIVAQCKPVGVWQNRIVKDLTALHYELHRLDNMCELAMRETEYARTVAAAGSDDVDELHQQQMIERDRRERQKKRFGKGVEALGGRLIKLAAGIDEGLKSPSRQRIKRLERLAKRMHSEICKLKPAAEALVNGGSATGNFQSLETLDKVSAIRARRAADIAKRYQELARAKEYDKMYSALEPAALLEHKDRADTAKDVTAATKVVSTKPLVPDVKKKSASVDKFRTPKSDLSRAKPKKRFVVNDDNEDW